MPEEYITRQEHEEFAKRIEEENHRQNRRIEKLEGISDRINSLATATEKLADNMQNMLKEQERQGQRLVSLESKDGKKWQEAVKIIGSAIGGAVITFLMQIILRGGV